MKSCQFISVFSLLFLCFSLTSISQNIIQNPGFESNLTNWGYWSNEGTGTASVVKSPVHSGNNAARILYPGAKDWSFSTSARIPVNAEEIYELSCWAKTTVVSSEANMSVVLYDAKQTVVNWVYNRLQLDKNLSEYNYFVTSFIVPDGVKYIVPRFEGWSNCDINVDDVSLVKVINAGISGDYAIENDSLKATIHLPGMSVDFINKKSSKTYTTGMAQFATVKSVDQLSRGSVQMNAEMLTGEKSPVTIVLTIEGKAVKMEILGDVAMKLNSDIKFPGIIPSKTDDYLIIPRGTGIMLPVTNPNPFGEFNTYSWKSTMPFVGVTNLKDGYMVVTDDQWDAAFQFEKPAGQGLYSFRLNQKPAKNSLSYNRTSYLVFVDNGYIEMCNWYRNHAEKLGYVKTFSQKLTENPNIEKLMGAADFWPLSFALTPTFLKTVKLMGMDRAIWNLTGSWGNYNFASIIDTINSLGFLSGRYDIFTDVWPPDHPEWKWYRTEGYPEDVIVEAGGNLKKGWLAYPNNQPFQGYYTCAGTHLAYAKKHVPVDLKTNRYNTRFIDVELAYSLDECYSTVHPVTRKEDAAARNEVLSYIKNDLDLVTGVEEVHDFAMANVDYSEGTMTIIPAANAGYDWSKPEPTDKTYELQNISPAMRIPLHGLVYHDVHIPTWYTGDGASKVPAFWDDKDLWNILYGTMPLFMPPSLQYWNSNLEKFITGYNLMTTVTRNIGYEKMVDHKFLTSDKKVQQTTFDNGWNVVVNFDTIPHTWDNKSLAAKGFYASDGAGSESFKLVVNGKNYGGSISDNRLFFNPFGSESNWKGLRTTQSVFLEKFTDFVLVSFIGKQNYVDINLTDLPFHIQKIIKVTEYFTGAEVVPAGLTDGWIRLNRPAGKSFFKLFYPAETTGLNLIPADSDLKLFPNPAQNQLIIEKPTQIENEYFSIINVVGQELMKQQFTGKKTEVDISSLKSGLYFLNLEKDGKVEVKKFVKL
jgi:hypothetical protein